MIETGNVLIPLLVSKRTYLQFVGCSVLKKCVVLGSVLDIETRKPSEPFNGKQAYISADYVLFSTQQNVSS